MPDALNAEGVPFVVDGTVYLGTGHPTYGGFADGVTSNAGGLSLHSGHLRYHSFASASVFSHDSMVAL